MTEIRILSRVDSNVFRNLPSKGVFRDYATFYGDTRNATSRATLDPTPGNFPFWSQGFHR